MELEQLLARTADNIVDFGTQAETRTLSAMAAAVADLRPGAAAALVDWDGSEIARLRAFGIVHGAVLRELSPRDQLRFLAEVHESDLALAG